MTTLVTGSDGLLGTALKKYFGGDFYFANRIDADLTDFQETMELFIKIKPRRVIHLAAKVGGVEANQKFPGSFYYENMLINLNVLKIAQITNVEKLVSFVSTCVFPSETEYPLSSSRLHDGEPHSSNLGYAYAKRMLEVQSRVFRQEYGANFITLIPGNMYGPGDNWNKSSGHVIPSLIHKVYEAKKNNLPLSVWGTGTPLREFIFSEDVARITLWALENYESNKSLIVSNPIETSIKNLVNSISKSMNFQGEVIWDSSKPNGQERKPSDFEPLRSLLPSFEFTTLENGLSTTIKWFEDNYGVILRK
jgi:GDP-L-fucose synthase